MKSVRISLGEFSLEGVLHPTKAHSKGVVVLCHPHPQHGGDMNNSLVVHLEKALAKDGWGVLKFNFRGIGNSGGGSEGGAVEVQDVLAAVDYIRGQKGEKATPLYIVGYSFGAAVGLQACYRDTEITGFVGVAPPLTMFPLDDLKNYDGSFYAIVGNRDSFVPLARVQEAYELAKGKKDLTVFPDCDHFFFGLEDQVASRVCHYLKQDKKSRSKK